MPEMQTEEPARIVDKTTDAAPIVDKPTKPKRSRKPKVEEPKLTRQQRRYAEREAKKLGPKKGDKGIVLNIIQVPSTKKFRIQQRGTMNLMRNRSGGIIEFETAEAAHQALIRLKEMTEKNLEASKANVEKFREGLAKQIAFAKEQGLKTGLEGTAYDPDSNSAGGADEPGSVEGEATPDVAGQPEPAEAE
jgi:hypothetical protein